MGYDIAQICLNGHVVNDSFREMPKLNKNNCDKCGKKTITGCQKCKTDIQGYYSDEEIDGGSITTAPLYCYNCGASFPWTKAIFQKAKEFAKELDLSEEDQGIFVESIENMMSDNTGIELYVLRMNKFIQNAGKAAGALIYNFAVDVASETAKRLLEQCR